MEIVKGHSLPEPLKSGLPATPSKEERATPSKEEKRDSDETDGHTWFSAKKNWSR